MLYFSSDHHLFHANVIKYCARPFQTVEEMNEVLIARWNEKVRQEDDVLYMGDFSMAFRSVEIFTSRLLGNKKLVPGNHDFVHSYHKKSRDPENRRKWIRKYEEFGWTVLPEQTTLEVPGVANFNLCHHPYTVDTPEDKYKNWRPKDDGKWLLCGHVHEKWLKKGRMINVGVDAWGGYPVSIDEISALMADKREFIVRNWGTNEISGL